MYFLSYIIFLLYNFSLIYIFSYIIFLIYNFSLIYFSSHILFLLYTFSLIYFFSYIIFLFYTFSFKYYFVGGASKIKKNYKKKSVNLMIIFKLNKKKASKPIVSLGWASPIALKKSLIWCTQFHEGIETKLSWALFTSPQNKQYTSYVNKLCKFQVYSYGQSYFIPCRLNTSLMRVSSWTNLKTEVK